MTAYKGWRWVSVGAEIGLTFVAGAASFALLAVVLAAARSDLLAVVLGVVSIVVVVAIARSWGIAYAATAAIAGLVAYDWFQFPPTHPSEVPDSTDLLQLLAYLGVAAFVGELAAHAGHRAQASEVARRRLADEQAALRRVATLVARGVAPEEVFAAVAGEVGELLEVGRTRIVRYVGEDEVEPLAGWSSPGSDAPREGRVALGRASVTSEVQRTGGVVRIGAGVGAPIVVDGRLWGAMLAWSVSQRPLPDGAEARLADFTALVATAISNTTSREQLARLAEEQAALRRVATLVARETPSTQVFATVAEEVGRLLGVDTTKVIRYEPHGDATVVGSWDQTGPTIAVGATWPLDADTASARVLRTGKPARIDDYFTEATGALGTCLRDVGIRSAVATPILVEGRLWGAMIAASRRPEPLPASTEARIAGFTELVATAISNIQARTDLATSRARIVAAADDERRRVVRDLHDGAQQRLVHTVVTLKLARRALQGAGDEGPALVTEALEQAERATGELRELAHGILPAVLTRGGLRAGVQALASRMPVPVEIAVSVERLSTAIEATAYFVVAEALTNVAKHAGAQRATVAARVADGTLELQVRDDGIGGARRDGNGLLGLGDRLAALDGRLRVDSPVEGGTLIAASIPLAR